MAADDGTPFTVVLETSGPLGLEIRVFHEEAGEAKDAARRALYRWHEDEYAPKTTIEELEDDSAHVLAVLKGQSEAVLTRKASSGLVRPS